VIGEAAARLTTAFGEAHPVVEWRDVVGFRNIAVHAYFAVNWEIVWVTATEDVPMLRDAMAAFSPRNTATTDREASFPPGWSYSPRNESDAHHCPMSGSQ
jgi:hypothetical protein